MFVNLTIIIPVYNSQKHLFECLNSACKQIEKNVEVIEMDETPTFGIETVIKIGVNGVIECK